MLSMCELDACEEETQLSETRWPLSTQHCAVPMDASGFALPLRLSFVYLCYLIKERPSSDSCYFIGRQQLGLSTRWL